MKYIFLFLSFSCFTSAKAQRDEVYENTYNNGLCSATIKLYADSNFFYEYGCEASRHVSFGKWVKRKDTIKLQPINHKTFPVIKSVERSTVGGDSIWLVILDNNGNNMTSQISTGLEIPGRGSYLFNLDSGGTKKFVYKRSGGKIVFRTLNKLFGQRLEIPVDTANYFVVSLNLSADWINSTHADWGESSLFSLLKKEGRLLTTKPPQQQFQKKL